MVADSDKPEDPKPTRKRSGSGSGSGLASDRPPLAHNIADAPPLLEVPHAELAHASLEDSVARLYPPARCSPITGLPATGTHFPVEGLFVRSWSFGTPPLEGVTREHSLHEVQQHLLRLFDAVQPEGFISDAAHFAAALESLLVRTGFALKEPTTGRACVLRWRADDEGQGFYFEPCPDPTLMTLGVPQEPSQRLPQLELIDLATAADERVWTLVERIITLPNSFIRPLHESSPDLLSKSKSAQSSAVTDKARAVSHKEVLSDTQQGLVDPRRVFDKLDVPRRRLEAELQRLSDSVKQHFPTADARREFVQGFHALLYQLRHGLASPDGNSIAQLLCSEAGLFFLRWTDSATGTVQCSREVEQLSELPKFEAVEVPLSLADGFSPDFTSVFSALTNLADAHREELKRPLADYLAYLHREQPLASLEAKREFATQLSALLDRLSIRVRCTCGEPARLRFGPSGTSKDGTFIFSHGRDHTTKSTIPLLTLTDPSPDRRTRNARQPK